MAQLPTSQERTPKRTQPPRRWLRRLLWTLGVLLALAWAAPILIAHSPLLDVVLQKALADFDGKAQVGRASLGWFSPIVLEDVEVLDGDGQRMLTVPRIEGSRSLLGLALDASDLGTFRIDKPSLSLVCAGEVINLEKSLARYLAPSTEPSGNNARRGLRIEVTEAQVSVRDADAARDCQLGPLGATVVLPRDAAQPIQVELRTQGSNGAHVSVEASIAAAIELHAQAERFPLAVLVPVLRRLGVGGQVDGLLDARVEGTWSAGKGKLVGKLATQGLGASGPWLGTDRIDLRSVSASVDASLDGNRIDLRTLELTCDLGKALVSGIELDTEGFVSGLNRPGCRVELDADLARLATMLPALAHLHRDLQLASGRLTARAASTASTDGVAWEGGLRASDLRGTRQGRPVEVQAPLTIDFRLVAPQRKLPRIDRWRCDCGFLEVGLSGTTEQFAATIRCDLDRLTEQLAPFVDFGTLRLSGKGQGQLNATLTPQGAFRAGGWLDFQPLRVAGLLGGAISEDRATIWLESAGQAGEVGIDRLDSATLRFQAGADTATVRSTQPIGDWSQLSVVVEASGDLERWKARARPWAPAVAAWQASGALQGSAKVKTGTARLEFADARVTVRDFVLGSPAAPSWREAALTLTSSGTLDSTKDHLEIAQLQINSSVLAGTAKGHIDHLGGKQELDLSGQLAYDAEKLGPPLRAYLGQGARLEGKGSRPFRLQGPLSAPTFAIASLSGDAALGWQSAQAYGCQVGPAELRTTLADGLIRLEPVDTTLNQGKLHLEGAVRFGAAGAVLEVGKGVRVEHLQLTPAACASALGYALPALANVLEAEGQVSFFLDAGRAPLAAPAAADLQGRFIIHSGRVSPGPLLRELGTLLRVPSGATLARESVVPVRMVNGRVYHSNLELAFPELTIRTQGSVGVDGTLDLVAEMPLPPKWLPAGGKGLANQVVRLPIRGTTSSPKLDSQALRAAMAQAVREAGQGALKHQLEKGLEGLIRPR